jgi:hypothetical protein
MENGKIMKNIMLKSILIKIYVYLNHVDLALFRTHLGLTGNNILAMQTFVLDH